jgi:orotidine-5'-phosphate decarboxylase
MTFVEKLRICSQRNHSLLCVGLDTDRSRLPDGVGGDALAFNRAVIEVTSDLVCAYKPNIAFYEAMGEEGGRILKETLGAIPGHIPVILDAKRGDIGNTARMYARAFFEELGVDAVTVNPYMGFDAVEPFLSYEDRCAFVLCLTSNPGAMDFQHLSVARGPLYRVVAEKVVEWNRIGSCGLVVGATRAEALKELREIASGLPFLIPGIGTQGGDLEQAVHYGTDPQGELAIINASRAVLYASNERDFAEAARRVASEIRRMANRYRENRRK